LLPLVGAILGALFGLLGRLVDRSVDLPASWEYSPSTASTVLAAIVGATAALTGFVVTVTVLVVQMATGTFSARYMRLWYRDRMLKATLAVLIGTLTFSFSLLRRVEDNYVPNLGVTVAGALVVVSLLLFLLFFDRFTWRSRRRSNAPTTAVQVLDHLGETLRQIGTTDLAKLAPHRVEGERPTVVMRGRRWEDFLALGVTEIREFGAASIQVMRRLRAVLEELRETVLPEHRAAVEEELNRLDATLAERWSGSVDLDRALIADGQGIGGPSKPDRAR